MNSVLNGMVLDLKGAYPVQEGPLNHLRLAVKDLFHLAGVPTSAGNPHWLESHPVPDETASSVLKLLNAGAELVGKTLTDELAYSLNGINYHFGTPCNYAAEGRIPGGSSSGSAVAVSMGLADIGLGTDTGGSIRVPASYNGLFGLRPTHGVIEMDNMVPLAPQFDTIGWMTRDLETLSKVADVMLPPQTVHLPKQLVVFHPIIQGRHLWTDDATNWLADRAAVFETVSHIELDESLLSFASETYRTLQGYQAWQVHSEWITNEKPVLGSDIAARFDWCRTITEAQYEQAERDRASIRRQIDDYLPSDDTVVMMPTTPGAAPLLDETPEELADYRNELMGLTALAGLTRRPQLHLPVLKEQGAPWGVSLFGAMHQDKALIALAERLLEVSDG